MPTPSKFTADRRKKILEALSVGASRRTACAVAGIDDETLRRWLEQGKNAEAGGRWAEFYAQVGEAEAHPRMRALGVIYKELPDNPVLAWKFVERREPGYAPPMPQAPAPPAGPVVIALSFQSGPVALALPEPEVIEGEVVEDEQDISPDPAPPAPA